MINNFVLGVAVMLLTGLLFGKIAKLFRLPNITGYLLGGLIIGPMLLNLIFPSFKGIIGTELIHTLSIVAEIELGFIAFAVGTEFKLSYFKKVGATPVIVAFAESLAAVLFIIGGVMLVGLLVGVPLYFALCLGAVGAATAPAATILVIRQYRAKGPFTQTLLSVVAIDDASALIYFGVAMAIIQSLINPGSNIAMTIIMPFIEIIGSAALGIFSGILLTLLVKPFSSKGNRLVLVVALLFLNIGVCLMLREYTPVSLSPLLACMFTGAIFTNASNKVEDVMPIVDGITPPLVVLFFILSGAELKLEALGSVGVILLVSYLVFRVAGKVIGSYVSCKACKVPPKATKWLGFGLLPQGGIAIGLSAIVVSTLASAPNVDPKFNGDMLRVIILCAVFISEIFGPLLSKLALIKTGEAQIDVRKRKGVALAGATGGEGEPPQEE